MGSHETASHRVLPQAVPQHLPWRHVRRAGRTGVAAEEPLPPARAQHSDVRMHRNGARIRRLHGVPVAVLQANASTTGTASQAELEHHSEKFLLFLLNFTTSSLTDGTVARHFFNS